MEEHLTLHRSVTKQQEEICRKAKKRKQTGGAAVAAEPTAATPPQEGAATSSGAQTAPPNLYQEVVNARQAEAEAPPAVSQRNAASWRSGPKLFK